MALEPFEKKPVIKCEVKITKAGDGLSDALQVDPVEMHVNDRVFFVMEAEVGAITFKRLSPAGNDQTRVHTLVCQPPETLVRVGTRHGGRATTWRELPIAEVGAGDIVQSWRRPTPHASKPLGMIRQHGSAVAAVGTRDYEGELVSVTARSGERSSYTPDHQTVAVLNDDLLEGNHVVYVMRRGEQFRVGRVQWRAPEQNRWGIGWRAWGQDADAMWVLSAHTTEYEAALAEAVVQHEYGLPGWQFSRKAGRERMPLADFWKRVGGNADRAESCLAMFGRDVRFPLWEKTDGRSTSRVNTVRACNLMSGMRACVVDEIQSVPGRRDKATGVNSGAWQPIVVSRRHYEGPVYSIEVEDDHTYVADGIVTHNCQRITQVDGADVSAYLDDAEQHVRRALAEISDDQRTLDDAASEKAEAEAAAAEAKAATNGHGAVDPDSVAGVVEKVKKARASKKAATPTGAA